MKLNLMSGIQIHVNSRACEVILIRDSETDSADDYAVYIAARRSLISGSETDSAIMVSSSSCRVVPVL
jgi:hypothetical protein